MVLMDDPLYKGQYHLKGLYAPGLSAALAMGEILMKFEPRLREDHHYQFDAGSNQAGEVGQADHYKDNHTHC